MILFLQVRGIEWTDILKVHIKVHFFRKKSGLCRAIFFLRSIFPAQITKIHAKKRKKWTTRKYFYLYVHYLSAE